MTGAVAVWSVTGTTAAQTPLASDSLRSIISEIRDLEGDHEPKCYATASRLEEFIYGTPLADDARFRKNDLQKSLVADLWRAATPVAAADGRATVARRDIEQAAADQLPFRRRANDDWEIAVPNAADQPLVITATDKRQYSSVVSPTRYARSSPCSRRFCSPPRTGFRPSSRTRSTR